MALILTVWDGLNSVGSDSLTGPQLTESHTEWGPLGGLWLFAHDDPSPLVPWPTIWPTSSLFDVTIFGYSYPWGRCKVLSGRWP